MWSDSIAVFGRIQINSRALQFCRVSIRSIKAVLIWWILLPRRYTFADQLVYTTISRQCMLGRWWKDPCFTERFVYTVCAKKLRQLFRGQWPGIYKSPERHIYIYANIHAYLCFCLNHGTTQKQHQPSDPFYKLPQIFCKHWTCTLFLPQILKCPKIYMQQNHAYTCQGYLKVMISFNHATVHSCTHYINTVCLGTLLTKQESKFNPKTESSLSPKIYTFHRLVACKVNFNLAPIKTLQTNFCFFKAVQAKSRNKTFRLLV